MFDLTREELSEALEKEIIKRIESRSIPDIPSILLSIELLLPPMCHVCKKPIAQDPSIKDIKCSCPCHNILD